MYGVLDKFTIKFETLTIYRPQNAVVFLKERFMNNERIKYGHTLGGVTSLH